MKTPPFILILLSLLNLGAVGFLALKLSKVEELVAGVSQPALVNRSLPSPAIPQIAAQEPAKNAIDTSDPLAGLDLKKASDIKKLLDQMPSDLSLERKAQVVAEMDEWIFAPEEEGAANTIMDAVVAKLRDLIASRIAALSKSAVEAANGKSAAEKIVQVNSLLSLYPAPKTDEQRAQLEQTTSGILSASRRVEDIRRLRYNAWAIAQIEIGLSGYYTNKKTVGTDEDKLTKSCITSLKVIDPAFLESAALDLYNYVFGLTRDAVSDKFRVKLATGLADAATNRRTPLDF